MKHQALLFTGLIGAGVVLGATLLNTNQPDIPTPNSSSRQNQSSNSGITSSDSTQKTPSSHINLETVNETLSELQNKLQQEIDHRKILESKIALLEKKLKSSSDNSEDSEQNAETATANPHRSGFSGPGTGQSSDWFNAQAMLDAGVDPAKVNFIKESFEQAEMDKLYLRDQAKREGWLNDKRYTDAAKEIADRTKALRNELTEEEFDAYLFAAGRSNRVVVSSVLSTSPASNAGIQAGDTILRYDNKRVYNWSDLTTATSEGSPNDTVIVTIERNGQTQQVYLPRGPLGIRLATDSVAP